MIFAFSALASAFGGIFAYALTQIHTGTYFSSWRALFILEGIITILVAPVFWFLFPISPTDAWFLTPEERFAAVERLRHGQTGVRCAQFKGAQVREAVGDVKVWLVALMMASAYTVNGAVSGFGPLIVSTFGWSALDSILFQFPLGALCFLVILLICRSSKQAVFVVGVLELFWIDFCFVAATRLSFGNGFG